MNHPLDEIGIVQIRHRAARHEFVHAGFVVLAALPNHLIVRGCGAMLHPVAHHPVERAAAQAAAHHEERLLVRIEPVESVALFPLRGRGRGDLLADGIAGEQDAVGREEFLHPLVGRADAGGAFRQDLVGQARIRILLLQQAGDTLVRGAPKQRSAGEAADADRYVGLERLEDFSGFADALDHLEGKREVLGRKRTLEPGYGQADDLVACGGYAFHLHFPFGADEQDFRLRADFLDGVRNGKGGEDVSAGSAAADDDARIIHLSYR